MRKPLAICGANSLPALIEFWHGTHYTLYYSAVQQYQQTVPLQFAIPLMLFRTLSDHILNRTMIPTFPPTL